MNYKRRAIMITIPIILYFLVIAYKANVCYYDNVSYVKRMTPKGIVTEEAGESVVYCIFEAITDVTEYFKIPKGIKMKVVVPIFLIGTAVTFSAFLYSYFYWKQREENREGHEHGGAHFMSSAELIAYQNKHTTG